MYDAMREKERDEKLEVRLKSMEQKIDGRLTSMEQEVSGVSKSVAELKGSIDMLLSIIRKSGV